MSPSRDSAKEAPFATMYHAFFTFACIGKHHDTYVPMDPKDRQEIFPAQYFDREQRIPVLVSRADARLVAEGVTPTEALGMVTSPTVSIPIVEGWADGGISVFH